MSSTTKKENSFSIHGTCVKVFDEVEHNTANGPFFVRDFVIKIDGEYPQVIKFQLTADRVAFVDEVKEGDQLEVFFSLSGKMINKDGKDMCFTNLAAWKVLNHSKVRQRPQPAAQAQQPQAVTEGVDLADIDELPF